MTKKNRREPEAAPPGASSEPGSAGAAETTAAPAGSEASESDHLVEDDAMGDQVDAAEELSPEEALQAERDELHERWLRAVAELDNFRKRTRRQLDETRRFAVADLLRKLLDVLDNFERALRSMSEADDSGPDLADFRAGVQLIAQQFQDVLAEQGVSRIEALTEEFDPNLHEAIQHMEIEGVAAGHVAEVVQPGYKLHDLVLRPSRVIVAK